MQAHDIAVASGLQAPRSGAGLVPYTTSQTNPPAQQTSTVFVLSSFTAVSAAENRLRRLKHHVRTAGRLIRETMHRAGRKWRAVFVTLTYRPGERWAPKHVASFLDNVRKWGTRQGVRVGYVWVAEMQKRCAVHYHLVIWVPAGLRLPRPDGHKGWWKHGTSNVQTVKRNAVGYLMKYVSKGGGDYPDLPQGARICGSGGLDAMARDELHYWRLPRYVRERLEPPFSPRIATEWVKRVRQDGSWQWQVVLCPWGGARAYRRQGGGWSPRWAADGEVYKSEFGLYAIAQQGRGEDCNGAKRRPDTVVLLSDTRKREKAFIVRDPLLLDLVREADYYAYRAAKAAAEEIGGRSWMEYINSFEWAV